MPPMPEIKGENDIDNIVRSHNSTIHNLRGQLIIGRIIAVGKNDVYVDLGWKEYQRFFKHELSSSQIYSQIEDEKRKKGEFKVGDQLRFRIESLETPYGDMFVSTQKMHSDIRRDLVWEELKMAFDKGILITGRILNPTSGGYAVGIAGYVAFCPLSRLSQVVERRIGVLQPFRILSLTDGKRKSIVVSDASMKYVGRGRLSPYRDSWRTPFFNDP